MVKIRENILSWKFPVLLTFLENIDIKIYDVPMKFARKLIHGVPVH